MPRHWIYNFKASQNILAIKPTSPLFTKLIKFNQHLDAFAKSCLLRDEVQDYNGAIPLIVQKAIESLRERFLGLCDDEYDTKGKGKFAISEMVFNKIDQLEPYMPSFDEQYMGIFNELAVKASKQIDALKAFIKSKVSKLIDGGNVDFSEPDDRFTIGSDEDSD